MHLLLLRHGPAGVRSAWNGDDAERPLTKQGAKKVKAIARRLRAEGVEPDLVLTSPYARCTMTAAIVAEVLGGMDAPLVEPSLAPGFAEVGAEPLLSRHGDATTLLVVGHEPDLSLVVGQLTGARILLQKGGLAELDVDREQPRAAVLVRLQQPAHLLG